MTKKAKKLCTLWCWKNQVFQEQDKRNLLVLAKKEKLTEFDNPQRGPKHDKQCTHDLMFVQGPPGMITF